MNFPERLESVRDSDSLSATLMVLRRRWLLIVAIVVACMAVAVVRHERSAKSYQASASVAFQEATLPDAALQVSPSGSSEPQRAADTEVLIAHSGQVAQAVRAQLHSHSEVKELLKLVTVEAAPNADVLNIAATTHDPLYSARLANAFANQYIAFKTAAQVKGIEAAEDKLRQQIAALPAGSSARASLEQSQQRLSGLRAVAGGGANVIGVATTPGSPSGSGLAATAVIGIVIGLAIAIAVVFLLEALDRRLKTIEDFERGYGLPALAGVPQTAFGLNRAEERTGGLEPYRILRSALEFAAVTRPLDSLLVTSAVSGEGKTTVAVDLAHAVALTGRPVTLLELDLRRPTFASHFRFRPEGGVTTALREGVRAGRLLSKPLSDAPSLSVLTAGGTPPNPSELLGSAAFSEILSELMSEGGLLVIDAPPLNPVSDAQVLLNNRLVQGVLMVGRVDMTTREEVARACAILARHTVAPVGIVVTGLRDPGRYGYEAYGAPEEPSSSDPRDESSAVVKEEPSLRRPRRALPTEARARTRTDG
jgi:capsular exopolysaccharide synthesis family protein